MLLASQPAIASIAIFEVDHCALIVNKDISESQYVKNTITAYTDKFGFHLRPMFYLYNPFIDHEQEDVYDIIIDVWNITENDPSQNIIWQPYPIGNVTMGLREQKNVTLYSGSLRGGTACYVTVPVDNTTNCWIYEYDSDIDRFIALLKQIDIVSKRDLPRELSLLWGDYSAEPME